MFLLNTKDFQKNIMMFHISSYLRQVNLA